MSSVMVVAKGVRFASLQPGSGVKGRLSDKADDETRVAGAVDRPPTEEMIGRDRHEARKLPDK